MPQSSLDRKLRPLRRSFSNSSSSSSSSSSTSSSSSSYHRGRISSPPTRKSSTHWKEGRPTKKSRSSSKRGGSSNDRFKHKKSKSSHGKYGSTSKSSSKKSSHSLHREHKDYERDPYSRSARSPSRHKRKSSSKKNHSPSASGSRKSRKLRSPSPYKRTVYRSSASRSPERFEYHMRGVDQSVVYRDYPGGSSSKLRDPRISERSQDRFGHDSPMMKRYERDEYFDRRDARSPTSYRLGDDRKELVKHRDYYHLERESYEASLRDGRDKDFLRDEADERGRYRRDPDYPPPRCRDDELDPERDYYALRHAPPMRVSSRENSVEKSYEDRLKKYEGERERYESQRTGYLPAMSQGRRLSDDYPVDALRYAEDRRPPRIPPNPLSVDPRFDDDRRTRDSSLDLGHPDPWKDRGGLAGDMYPPPPHPSARNLLPPSGAPLGLRRGDWPPESSRLIRSVEPPPHAASSWESATKKKRMDDWPGEEYLEGEWGDDRPWPPEKRLPPIGAHPKEWPPRPLPPRPFVGAPWDPEDRADWPPSTMRDRIPAGARLPPLGKVPPYPPVPVGGLPLGSKDDIDSLRGRPPVLRKEFSVHPKDMLEQQRIGDPAFLDNRPVEIPAVPGSNAPAIAPATSSVKAPPTAPEEAPPIEKDNFSDFSDDPDDFLNQDVESSIQEKEMTSYKDILDEEEKMVLEEISDDELEEEKQTKLSVADALDINWLSLTTESRSCQSPSHGSALRKFQALALLSELGVSTKYAKPEIIEKIRENCLAAEKRNHNEDSTNDCVNLEKVLLTENIKSEPDHESNDALVSEPVNSGIIKKENVSDDDALPSSEMSTFSSDDVSNQDNKTGLVDDHNRDAKETTYAEEDTLPIIPPVVVAEGAVKGLRQEAEWRKRLRNVAGRRLTLSAKEDLTFRRRLCGLPEEELETETFTFNAALFKEVAENFRKTLSVR